MYIKRLEDVPGIENHLKLNNDKYHNTRRLMFNNSKLERDQKRRLSQRRDETEVDLSKFTRRYVDTVSNIKAICFCVIISP